jgi:hypothetical protein
VTRSSFSDVRDRAREEYEKTKTDAEIAKEEAVRRVQRISGRKTLKQAAQAAKSAGSNRSVAAGRGGPGDTPAGEEPEPRDIFKFAQENATASAPVDATFAPTTAPEQTGMLAMAGGSMDSGEDLGAGLEALAVGDADSDSTTLGMVGISPMMGGGESSEGSPLDVDDQFGATGGMF